MKAGIRITKRKKTARFFIKNKKEKEARRNTRKFLHPALPTQSIQVRIAHEGPHRERRRPSRLFSRRITKRLGERVLDDVGELVELAEDGGVVGLTSKSLLADHVLQEVLGTKQGRINKRQTRETNRDSTDHDGIDLHTLEVHVKELRLGGTGGGDQRVLVIVLVLGLVVDHDATKKRGVKEMLVRSEKIFDKRRRTRVRRKWVGDTGIANERRIDLRVDQGALHVEHRTSPAASRGPLLLVELRDALPGRGVGAVALDHALSTDPGVLLTRGVDLATPLDVLDLQREKRESTNVQTKHESTKDRTNNDSGIDKGTYRLFPAVELLGEGGFARIGVEVLDLLGELGKGGDSGTGGRTGGRGGAAESTSLGGRGRRGLGRILESLFGSGEPHLDKKFAMGKKERVEGRKENRFSFCDQRLISLANWRDDSLAEGKKRIVFVYIVTRQRHRPGHTLETPATTAIVRYDMPGVDNRVVDRLKGRFTIRQRRYNSEDRLSSNPYPPALKEQSRTVGISKRGITIRYSTSRLTVNLNEVRFDIKQGVSVDGCRSNRVRQRTWRRGGLTRRYGRTSGDNKRNRGRFQGGGDTVTNLVTPDNKVSRNTIRSRIRLQQTFDTSWRLSRATNHETRIDKRKRASAFVISFIATLDTSCNSRIDLVKLSEVTDLTGGDRYKDEVKNDTLRNRY